MEENKYKALDGFILDLFPAFPDCETALEQCRRGNDLAIVVGRIFQEELTPELKMDIMAKLLCYLGAV